VTLDVLQQADALLRGGGSVIRPQEPEARDAVLIYQAVDVGYREAFRSGGAHLDRDDTASPP
jgi:hypothetical protein